MKIDAARHGFVAVPLRAALAVWFSCLGAGAALAQPVVPSADLPTVAAVQGDDTLGLEVASKFLTGCEYSCRSLPPQSPCNCRRTTFHAPSTWSPVQLHVNAQNVDYSPYYWDKTVIVAPGKTGMDESAAGGIEGSRLLLYAGEGHPDGFMADFYDAQVDLGMLSVGDRNVRYLFMLACNLFAHGPRDLLSPGKDFTHPETFNAARVVAGKNWKDDDFMADVFNRWGQYYGSEPSGLRSPLNPRLRLACGGSSRIGAGSYPTHLFWFYSTVVHLPPADAWLVGLFSPENGSEPLCMSRGDSFLTSGLADRRFESEPLAAETPGHPKEIYIEYPVLGTESDPVNRAAFLRAPARALAPPQETPEEAPLLPVIQVGPAPPPAFLQSASAAGSSLAFGFRGGPASMMAPGFEQSFELPGQSPPIAIVHGEDICLEQHPLNGSLVLSWRPPAKGRALSSTESRDTDQAGDALALNLLQLAQPPGQREPQDEDIRIVPRDTLAIQLEIDEVPADRPEGSETPVRTHGCLYQRQTTAVHLQHRDVPILGEGGERFLARCPAAGLRQAAEVAGNGTAVGVCQRTDSPVVSFVYNNMIVRGTRPSSQKTKAEAEEEARAQLAHRIQQGAVYERVGLRWGYRAAPLHCSQREMYLIYQFDFASRNRVYDGSAPISIEVAAHELGGKDRVEDTWTCSTETVP